MGSLGFLAGPPIIGFLADADHAAVGALAADPRRRRPCSPWRAARPGPARRPARRGRASPSRCRCRDVRRGDLRPRRRARRLDGRHQPRLGPLGRAPRAGRRGDPGRQPRPPRPRGGRRPRRAGPARGGGGVPARRRGRATPRASTPCRAPPRCSRCRRRDRDLVRRPLARARLAAAGLGVPAVLVTADKVANGKPAPDAYLLAAERLGVDPAACLVLEDAPRGVAAGRAAGMTVWAVATTHARADLDGRGRRPPRPPRRAPSGQRPSSPGQRPSPRPRAARSVRRRAAGRPRASR